MKKIFSILFCIIAINIFAQQKYGLVIGNGLYTSFGRLPNALNDANDMKNTLENLGFIVDMVIDGSRVQMIESITRFKNKLSVQENSYGFFFYAGHGVQHNGINYLIPANADIPNANYLGDTSVSMQTMLTELNEAGNALNIVVLDACRDFPATWSRSLNRGLTVVTNQPADSIIVYATSAGSVASDGIGRNGLFTSQLLKNLQIPDLEISEVFRMTGADVASLSNRQQIPAIYNQFFGRAYIGTKQLEQSQNILSPGLYNNGNMVTLPQNNSSPQPQISTDSPGLYNSGTLVAMPPETLSSRQQSQIFSDRPGLYVNNVFQGPFAFMDAIDWIGMNFKKGNEYTIVLGQDELESNILLSFQNTEVNITLKSSNIEHKIGYAVQNPTNSLFTVGPGVTFILEEGVSLTGLENNSRPLVRIAGGTFIMNGGNITGNKVTSNNGGGVRLESGSFIMNNGIISKNSSTYGGGVYVNGGTFEMNGGIIGENIATYSFSGGGGGGVYVNNGTFIKSSKGGVIYGVNGSEQANKASGGSAAVYCGNGRRDTTVRISQALDSTQRGAAGGWFE